MVNPLSTASLSNCSKIRGLPDLVRNVVKGDFHIIEPTLVCIHASVPDADAPARLLAPQQVKDDETRVEFYGIKILPNKVATGVGNIQDANAPCIKFLRDGQLLILRDGKTYTIQGMEVK